jgi:transcriptional regulator of acetoin/glycerol metabolism
MVVLAPGREIGPADIPRQIREGGGARFLPVHVGPVVRERAGVEGRELEFIVRSLVELKLQVEELRRQLGEERLAREALARASGVIGTPTNVMDGTFAAGREAPQLGSGAASAWGGEGSDRTRFGGGGIEPRDQPPPPSVVTIRPGMTMAAIERAAIEAALRETRGNRRKAAELLGIGERTLYRKLREYQLLVDTSALD